MVAKINESNKYFLGVKLNTNYLKINTIAKFEELTQNKVANAKINDLPI